MSEKMLEVYKVDEIGNHIKMGLYCRCFLLNFGIFCSTTFFEEPHRNDLITNQTKGNESPLPNTDL